MMRPFRRSRPCLSPTPGRGMLRRPAGRAGRRQDPAAGGESARRNCAAGGTWRAAPAIRTPPRGLPGATDGNQGENTGTYSNRTLGGTDFRVEPPEHTSGSLLRSRRCSDPNPATVGDTNWLWFQVIGQKRYSRQVRRKRLGSNSTSSPPQIPVPRGKPCRQESHIWRRCRRLKWSLGHWNCRHTVSAARRPGCCAAHRWTEAITRFLVLWAVTARNRLSAGLRNLWVDQFPVTPFFVRDVGMDRAAVDLDGMQSHHRIVSLWREKSVCNSLSVRSRTMPLDLSASNSPPATAA